MKVDAYCSKCLETNEVTDGALVISKFISDVFLYVFFMYMHSVRQL